MQLALIRFLHMLLLAVLVLAACSQREEARATSYQGVALPQPQTPAEIPPAWLLVNDQAVAGTPGSYTIETPKGVLHADAPPPQMMEQLATASVPAATQPTIIIGSDSVSEFQARIGAWTPDPVPRFDPSKTEIVESERNEGTEGLTAFMLEPLGGGDEILLVSITFDRGNADYYWRLTPAE